tara:strand:+ start:942 stop:1235 length:294 start_codon:yes stop_codon:yes gene_type:complete
MDNTQHKCKCGGVFRSTTHHAHVKTNRHIKYLANLDTRQEVNSVQLNKLELEVSITNIDTPKLEEKKIETNGNEMCKCFSARWSPHRQKTCFIKLIA